ncbi:NADP-dependent oxidoreductase domain-containing protein [Jimgerdemannia flammicorona]|uniref:NADP-dependent oxidoreductase domain-containing protein n=1 Tax=Jimgerdemannia flammicorona TaxID=994334 RepID=A0A433DFE1_9FUNG|nr:NADP-dependent oxidoreductase domain-containing protein [Jimgerdemannia flammicorona]
MAKDVPRNHLELSEVGFGAGVFSGVYDKIEASWPVEACRQALQSGINSFDTSPYYGRSEFILGDALHHLADEFPRSNYYIATKVGRYGYYAREFDYSSACVTASVGESLRRLHTDYLDIVYCHDVEFVPFENIVGEGGALEALFKLKVSDGYPLPVLLKIAQHQHAKGQNLDIILSYCHYTLQNTTLAQYAPLLRAAGVRYILNASPLSMGLFRPSGPPEWHPAHAELREAARKAMEVSKAAGFNIAKLASQYAFKAREEIGVDSTIIGLKMKEQVEEAVETWTEVKERERGLIEIPKAERKVMDEVLALLAPYHDYSWESPTKKEREG